MIEKKVLLRPVVCAIVLLCCSCASLSRGGNAEQIPIAKEGRMSKVVLAHVERRNTIDDGTEVYSHEDGLAFYFVIYPLGENYSRPVLKESQNFTIDGKPYWKNKAGAIDSYTVLFDEKTFLEEEPDAAPRVSLESGAHALIQKTIICGEALPPEGLVRYRFFFGYEQEIEEFDFLFSLEDCF